jgi:ribosomal protein L11 methyltransferase
MSARGGKATEEKRFVWQKLSPAKWEDVWQERLAWLGQRLVIIVLTGYKTLRIEAHQLTKAEADGLVREFRGQVRQAKPLSAADLEPEPRPPLTIGKELVVVGDESDCEQFSREKAPMLVIPASMAFGTGDHATTATCLRVLAETAKRFTVRKWEALDVGTGSGILAMAAKLFGARKVDAWDFDPIAVRVAKGNAKLNGIRGVSFNRADVLKWKPARKWDVVLANVYGPVLIEASRQIAAAVAPDGNLILSGILREQSEEVIAAFDPLGLEFERVVRKGKWVTLLARKSRTQRRSLSKRSPKKTNAAPSVRSSQAATQVRRKVRAPRSANHA